MNESSDNRAKAVRAILAFMALPAIVAGLAPWLISMIPTQAVFSSRYGAVLLATGSGILLAAVVSFYRRGRGTLAPWDPPTRLVVQDLYRFNRNPMYVGVVVILIGWAIVTGNPWNYAYAAVIPVVFHLRVVLYEEREMQRLFGQEWDAYRHAVPRWGVRLRPYIPSVEARGTTVGPRDPGP
jgi:protein-S-isoprenylcysteine O-methyltransferase Ste14